jgi:DNA-3-methyladenine glycosylase
MLLRASSEVRSSATSMSTKSHPASAWSGARLPRSFYRRDPRTVAPELLNKVLLSRDGRSGRVVEVEAYCGEIDPAAHTYRGKSARNAVMFGPPGFMYVYFTYGMHWCCNAVCGDDGEGYGVLIRALEPLTGLEQMRAARPRTRRDRDLCNGPGRLTQAMAITGIQNGIDLVAAKDGFTVVDDGVEPPQHVAGSARIGISRAKDLLWRWYVPDNIYVSKP